MATVTGGLGELLFLEMRDERRQSQLADSGEVTVGCRGEKQLLGSHQSVAAGL